MKHKQKLFFWVIGVFVVATIVIFGARTDLFKGSFPLPLPIICDIPADRIFQHPTVPTKFVSVVTSPVTSGVSSSVASQVSSNVAASRVASRVSSNVASAVTSPVASMVALRKNYVIKCLPAEQKAQIRPLTPDDLKNIQQQDYIRNRGIFTLSDRAKVEFLKKYEENKKKGIKEFVPSSNAKKK